ncbi:hypothetical protein ABW20_dc0107200 [Dactylellina cionopaga]|nr:hypothetical protein ABW20_dc0107200 [Dactylellina cionopaga]
MSQSEPTAAEAAPAPAASRARFTISPATRADLPDVINLFTLYAESLNIDLTFQSFAEELASLPGKYSPPTGQILLARRAQVAENPQSQSGPPYLCESVILDENSEELSREPTAVSMVVVAATTITIAASAATPHTAEAIGCVAVRPITFSALFESGDPSVKKCEMKRLYTLPSTRGQGVGKALIEDILEFAEGLGYEEMYLDTLATMTAALSIYEKYGFVRTKAYYHNPNEGVVFLKKELRGARQTT